MSLFPAVSPRLPCIILDGVMYRAGDDGQITESESRKRSYRLASDFGMESDIVLTGTVDSLSFPSGAVVLMGPSSASKSPLVKYLSLSMGGRLIRYGEPLVSITDNGDLAEALIRYSGETNIIGLDSVKQFVGRAGGASMGRGVSRELFAWLSDVSSLFTSHGKTLIVPLNISTDLEKSINEVREAARSNTNMLMTYAGGSEYVFERRTGQDKQRVSGTFSFAWKGDGEIGGIKVNSESSIDLPESFDAIVAAQAATPADIVAAAQRLAKRNRSISKG